MTVWCTLSNPPEIPVADDDAWKDLPQQLRGRADWLQKRTS